MMRLVLAARNERCGRHRCRIRDTLSLAVSPVIAAQGDG
jgi:hypothetical protein